MFLPQPDQLTWQGHASSPRDLFVFEALRAVHNIVVQSTLTHQHYHGSPLRSRSPAMVVGLAV